MLEQCIITELERQRPPASSTRLTRAEEEQAHDRRHSRAPQFLEGTVSHIVAQLAVLLDNTEVQLLKDEVSYAIPALADGLWHARMCVSDSVWENIALPMCRQHTLCALLHQDPHTFRALTKPRGYAGDAVMMDYMYYLEPPVGGTPLGRAIFRHTAGAPNGRSAISRRDHITTVIDEVASSVPDPYILAIACGHLREAVQSHALQTGQIREFVALDQDANSLALIDQEYGRWGVRTVHASAMDLLRRKLTFVNRDLVYAYGLFDYLSDSLAIRLVNTMFTMVRPGGKVLIANYVPTSHGRGYMEAFMDWRLVYRDEATLRELTQQLAPSHIADIRTFLDPFGNVAFLELTRSQ